MGSQVRNSRRNLEAGTTGPSSSCSATFLIQVQTTSPEMALPQIRWALKHQSHSRKCSPDRPSDKSNRGDSLVEITSSHMCLVLYKADKNLWHPPLWTLTHKHISSSHMLFISCPLRAHNNITIKKHSPTYKGLHILNIPTIYKFKFSLKFSLRDGWMVKSTDCSSRKLEFESWHPRGDS